MIKYTMLIMIILMGCGQQEIESSNPIPKEISLCDYDVEGACVMEEGRSMNIDPTILSWGLQTLEYEVNFFYPGLDFPTLAEENKLKISYMWANVLTQHQGTYDTANAKAKINLRRGDAVTPLMECSDRYYIALHEVLHFIADRYLSIKYELQDGHNVPYIFKKWAMIEGFPVDYTVEGRLYTLTWRLCCDLTQK